VTVFVVPLESYDLRYTEQWNRWFPRRMDERGIEYTYLSVTGDAHARLGGDVLSPIRTNMHRVDQVQRILELFETDRVRDGDTFFFHTLWFPGLEALAYVRDSLKIDFRIVAVLHAGSYDPWDFRARAGMDPWSAPLETSWLEIADQVLVASHFHRAMILGSRRVAPQKLIVTGLPFDSAEIRRGRDLPSKRGQIAFPHRQVPEKSPDVADYLRAEFGHDTVVLTRETSSTKSGYLDIIARSRVVVSDSRQETFGYSMLESAALGCVPLVPDRLCYREMYPQRYRFASRIELIDKARTALEGGFGPLDDLHPLIDWADGALDRMLDIVVSPAQGIS
jgi:hypothetical protein